MRTVTTCAQHARMLYAGQSCTFFLMTYKNIGNLLLTSFLRSKIHLGKIAMPQLTLTGLSAHMLCLKRVSGRSNVHFDLQRPRLPLKSHFTCRKRAMFTFTAVSTRTLGGSRSEWSNCFFKDRNEIGFQNNI